MNIIKNKKVFLNYYIKEKYESGIILKSWEVKSIYLKNIKIEESYINVKNNELFIFNLQIFNFIKNKNYKSIRKLLMHKKEILKLKYKIKNKGYTLIPLSFYFKNKFIKCQIGLAKGKKIYDKKKIIKYKNIKYKLF